MNAVEIIKKALHIAYSLQATLFHIQIIIFRVLSTGLLWSRGTNSLKFISIN
jgi:hypothetical protein